MATKHDSSLLIRLDAGGWPPEDVANSEAEQLV